MTQGSRLPEQVGDSFTFCAMTWAALLALAVGGTAQAGARVATFQNDDGTAWNVLITPREALAAAEAGVPAPTAAEIVVTPAASRDDSVAAPVPRDGQAAPNDATPLAALPCPGAAACPTDLARCYAAVYRSIPYRSSEYLVNPSYRHEATMEILLGQLRPTVIHKHQPAFPAAAPIPVRAAMPGVDPWIPYRPALYPAYPFGYYDFSRGPYSRYQRLFGYDGGWRTMFYVNAGYGSPYSPWY